MHRYMKNSLPLSKVLVDEESSRILEMGRSSVLIQVSHALTWILHDDLIKDYSAGRVAA